MSSALPDITIPIGGPTKQQPGGALPPVTINGPVGAMPGGPVGVGGISPAATVPIGLPPSLGGGGTPGLGTIQAPPSALAAVHRPGFLGGLFNTVTNDLGLGGVAHTINQDVLQPAIHYGIQQPWNDVESMIRNAPTGAINLAEGAFTHPIGTLENFANAAIAPLEHPGRDPFMDLVTLASFLPTPAALGGRLFELGKVLGGTSGWADFTARQAAEFAAAREALATKVGGAVPGTAEGAGAAVPAAALTRPALEAARYAPEGFRPAAYGSWNPVGAADTVAHIAGESPAENAALAESMRAMGPKATENMSKSSQLIHAIVFGQPLERRLIEGAGELQAPGMYFSRNPLIREIQKSFDQFHVEHPTLRLPVPGLWGTQQSRISKATLSTSTFYRNFVGRERVALQKFFKAPGAHHEAVALVMRGINPDDQIRFIKDEVLPQVKGRFNTARANTWLKNTEDAKQFLTTRSFSSTDKLDPEGKLLSEGRTYTLPTLRGDAPQELKDYLEQATKVSDIRTRGLSLEGGLSPVRGLIRQLAPKNVIEGNGIHPNLDELKARLADISGRRGQADSPLAAELRHQIQYWTEHPEGDATAPNPIFDSDLAGQLHYVPESFPNRAVGDFVRRPFSGGSPRAPSTLTHAYHGAILRAGGPMTNTARLIAESHAEATRFLYLTRIRQLVLASAAPTPKDIPVGDEVPIFLPNWNGRIAAGNEFTNNLLRDGSEPTPLEAEGGGKFMNYLRTMLMDPAQTLKEVSAWARDDSSSGGLRWAKQHGFPADATLADLHRFQLPNVGWVDRHLFGGLDKPPPAWTMSGSKAARFIMQGQDAINEVMKAMILYLKPAYFLPNFLSNAAMALVQQGFMAPVNMAHTYSMLFKGRGLSRDAVDTIKATSGGGYSAANLSVSGRTVFNQLRRATNWMAGRWATVIDDPLRLSSFIHEANAAGFTSAADIERLTTDPAYEGALMDVAMRSNDALINYARLGPAEQEYMKRMIFFYPWVKGATRYGYQLFINHPTVAFAQAPAGAIGQRWQSNVLGALPSWAQGFFPWGASAAGNPGAAALLQTPANLMQSLGGIFGGNPSIGQSFLQNLAPVESGLVTLGTGLTTIPHPATEPWWQAAVGQTFGGIPAITSLQDLFGPVNPYGYYPTRGSLQDVLGHFIVGGLWPREVNLGKMHAGAWREAHPQGSYP
jgi:hypothetical protein